MWSFTHSRLTPGHAATPPAAARCVWPIQKQRSLVCRPSSNGDSIPTSSQQPVVAQQWSHLYPQFLAADRLSADPASLSPDAPGDSLTQALSALEEAVESEDYKAAAQLRDASLAWLGGWWRPAASPQARGVNSSSSLLHISRSAASRWSGVLFTPADVMHFDLQGNCNGSELQMAEMLQQARYGTPLFEVFVLPQQQLQLQEGAGDNSSAASPGSSPASTAPSSSSSSSSSFTPVVVALQSVNRAFNELLGVAPARRRGAAHGGPSEPRYTNQRLLLLVRGDTITAAAVHAGNDSTLWTWHTNTHPAHATSSTSSSSSQPAEAASTAPSSHGIVGPLRPSGVSGGCVSGFTIDWHTIDHLRGPGSLARTGPDSFSFCRQPLPVDVLDALCSGSSSGSSGGGWDGSSVQLFRVDLQYMLPPSEPAAAAAAAADGAAVAAADGDASAAAEPAAGSDSSPSSSDSSTSSSTSSTSSSDNSWAQRVAAELVQLLHTPSSSSSSSLLPRVAELLTAAAVGTAPPGGVVSEAQQAVAVVEVPLRGAADAAADGAGVGGLEGGSPAVEFVRVVEPTAALSFGGWQVTASLT